MAPRSGGYGPITYAVVLSELVFRDNVIKYRYNIVLAANRSSLTVCCACVPMGTSTQVINCVCV